MRTRFLRTWCLVAVIAVPASAGQYSFTTGSPDGRIGTASRPTQPGILGIETGDDFILTSPTVISQASFTGLVPAAVSETQIIVEIFRVFPLDSTNPPSGHVPTRTNSPSDVVFDSRDSSAGGMSFTASILNPSFSAANSVLNGIHPVPDQLTMGEGPISGEEVTFSVTFTPPIVLPPGHYFFVPRVALSSGNFFWLSAPRPLFTGDLQSWIRNDNLAPDWLRIGTDIIGGTTPPTFNGSFLLSGVTSPKGDFNRDGNSDAIWRKSTTGENAMWLMNGTAVQTPALLPSVSDTNWKIAGVGDVDLDGKADVIWWHALTGQVVVWIMDGATRTSAGIPGTVADTNWKIAGVGDFDGDGRSDIVWRNSSTGQVVVWLLNGTAMSSAAVVTTVSDLNWNIVAVGDFDGDGRADLFWRHAVTGQNAVWFMNGTTVQNAVLANTVSNLNYQVVGAGDADGDGLADVFWRNAATGDVAVWLMHGASPNTGGLISTVSDTNWHIEAVGDVDGDGKADLMWHKVTTGETAIWLINGLSVKNAAFGPTVSDLNWTIAAPR